VDAAEVRLSASSALVVNGAGVRIKSLDLDGAMVVDAAPGAAVCIDGARVRNAGLKWQALKPEKPMTEEQFIRCARLAGTCRTTE
jgi:UDP-sugar pyrophosphorylase